MGRASPPYMDLMISWECSVCGYQEDGFDSELKAEVAFDEHVEEMHSDDDEEGDS